METRWSLQLEFVMQINYPFLLFIHIHELGLHCVCRSQVDYFMYSYVIRDHDWLSKYKVILNILHFHVHL